MQDVTQQAIDAIGAEQPADWRLEPRTHAARLPAAAGALRRILERPEVGKLVATFEETDPRAGSWQKVFKRWSRLAFASRFGAITVGAVALLYVVGAIAGPGLTLALTVEYALIVASLVASFMLAMRRPFEKWMLERGKAENARLDMFKFATQAAETPREGELPLLPLQLEYFRRYQLDVQRLYYRQRGTEHANGARKIRIARWAATLLVAVAAVPAALGLLATWAPSLLPSALVPAAELARSHGVHAALLVLGIVTSAMADLVAALSLADLDLRNSVRYLSNADNLDALREKYLAAAREAAAAGDADKVGDFIELGQMYISSEHREWVLVRDLAKDLTLEHFAQLRLPGRRR